MIHLYRFAAVFFLLLAYVSMVAGPRDLLFGGLLGLVAAVYAASALMEHDRRKSRR